MKPVWIVLWMGQVVACVLTTPVYCSPVQREEGPAQQAGDQATARSGTSNFFEKGVLLAADGKPIQTDWFGHAAPALLDVDRDGDLDLLVGQYTGGDVLIFDNAGSNKAPVYSSRGKLVAGGEVARVQTFCCVGFTPCIVDFDDDGYVDILSGSYPGELSLFRGNANGTFQSAASIRNSDGESLKPGLATTAFAADLDHDGDYDLLSSLKKGGVAVCYNQGTSSNPAFGAWEDLLVENESIPFSHTGPVVLDFDRDGIDDLVVAHEESVGKDTWRSQLLFYRNISRTGKPVYKKPQVILEDHVGLRLKVFPVDYDGDGHLDFLVGDMFADCPQDEYTGFVWFYRGKPRETETTTANDSTNPDNTTSGSLSNEKVAFTVSTRNNDNELILVVDVEIQEHWHIYGNTGDDPNRTRLELPSIPGIDFSEPQFPVARRVMVFGHPTSQFENRIQIKVPFRIDRELFDRKNANATMVVHCQVCGDESVGGVCLPTNPVRLEFSVPESR